jgi:hypothetical protein
MGLAIQTLAKDANMGHLATKQLILTKRRSGRFSHESY